ncbi:prolyl aminopeptidase [Acidiferrobacter sp.]|uniref:prolyl aminopeptidase n=1 Tax=Acidiferrobacter sp. TaxID=1872107 RepID=UPI00263978A6|nr:prolyl aminopeptidase [Acidiferrobacter sp.]
MATLYPPIEPYAQHRIAVAAPHALYVEECGNPRGLPVVFLHGGPGAGCEPYHRRFFDPARYRVILFDQRGAGRSLPHAALAANTTSDLVADIEHIRAHLGIERWLVFGGSWGSTLALVYGEAHPERVLGLILRGIFLCRPSEIRWFYQEGASWVYPDYWADFIAPIPEPERGDMVSAYYRRLTGLDEDECHRCARAWSLWEGRTANLSPKKDVVDFFGLSHTALALARIECHYFMHDSFLRENQILADAHRLADIPGTIVQGRYDLICPMRSAWELHGAWPRSVLTVVPEAAHSATEPGITSALVEATDAFACNTPWPPTR